MQAPIAGSPPGDEDRILQLPHPNGDVGTGFDQVDEAVGEGQLDAHPRKAGEELRNRGCNVATAKRDLH